MPRLEPALDAPSPDRGSAVCVAAAAAPPDGVVGAGAISTGLGDATATVDVAITDGVSVAAGGVLVAGAIVDVAGIDVLVGTAAVAVAAACTMMVPIIAVVCTEHQYVYVPGTVNVLGPNEFGDGWAPESHIAAPGGTAVEVVECGTPDVLAHVHVTVSPTLIVAVDVPLALSVNW